MFSSFKPSENTGKSIADVTNELKAWFEVQHPSFKFGGHIGQGAYGVTFSLTEKISENRSRRLAIKRALPMKEHDLRNEIEYLKRLRGSEHIVTLVASLDEKGSMQIDGRTRLQMLKRGRPAGLQNAIAGITGPIAVLEYLEHGHIDALLSRLVKNDVTVPNRVLWAMFLCLIRACVALAYPPNGDEGQPNRLETIPTDGTAPSMIEHADLHLGNIMIGATDGFAEHLVIPPIKFIDFGRTREVYRGTPDNVWKISRIMLEMVAKEPIRISAPANIKEYKGIKTRATEILPVGNGWKYPRLDPDFADFMAGCLAHEEKDRLDLPTMLNTAEQAVRTKTAAAYPNNPYETDTAIARFVQENIYDAPHQGPLEPEPPEEEQEEPPSKRRKR